MVSIGPNIGLCRTALSGGGSTYDADASTLFAAMSVQPDATRKGVINTFILALKTAGVWTQLDVLYVMAAATAQAGLLNWKAPGTRDLVAVNAPAFVADQGFAGNGTTSYLNTQFVPSTDGVQYTLNDASFGVYSRTNADGPSSADMGARNASNVASSMMYTKSGSIIALAVNQGASAAPASALASTGLWVARRTASNAIQMFRNGSSVATAADVSTARTAVVMLICARMSASTPGEFSTRQYAMAFIGASMTAQQQLDLFTATEAYLDAISAGVV